MLFFIHRFSPSRSLSLIYHCFSHFRIYILNKKSPTTNLLTWNFFTIATFTTTTSSSSSSLWLLFFASFPVAHLSKWIIHIRMCWMSLATVLSDGIAVVFSWFVVWKFKYRNQIGYNTWCFNVSFVMWIKKQKIPCIHRTPQYSTIDYMQNTWLGF